MHLSELVEILRSRGFDITGTWEDGHGRNGIYLGHPDKHFPFAPGPQYTLDTTSGKDRLLTQPEVEAIRRRFGIL